MEITLIENFRAVFYTPFYAAFALGAYASEGLDVQRVMSSQPAETMQRLLAGKGMSPGVDLFACWLPITKIRTVVWSSSVKPCAAIRFSWLAASPVRRFALQTSWANGWQR